MDYQGFTNDSLVKLYEGVREALAADEAFGGEGRYRVRKTPASARRAVRINFTATAFSVRASLSSPALLSALAGASIKTNLLHGSCFLLSSCVSRYRVASSRSSG